MEVYSTEIVYTSVRIHVTLTHARAPLSAEETYKRAAFDHHAAVATAPVCWAVTPQSTSSRADRSRQLKPDTIISRMMR